eukprot:CAMPEP_0203662940 /NCGR_PEP_ID=MMETSP0090-20130426/730_1 /ASSEMBLY_ACC=CAM_ASM_001088 /TAXON_ID=426623 /ORGANISM="Chaetoceros affinis, Strain CCMP159" /LENGTH=489 /DNA_ID=CAMNT_0050525789 /DNA_START=67 /DNA_END=1536 /DNA_ORIENTATION=-
MKCYFQVSVAGSAPEKVVFQLDTTKCPKTCENFASFCKSDGGKSYKNTTFHRIIPGFMVQGGDYQNGDGTGGEAFEGGTLKDEDFSMKHDGPFILSMANRGENTGGSQFFITLGKASHLDGKHVAFGKVIYGQDVIREMEKVETDEKDKPVNMQKVKILDSGIGDGEIVDSDSDSASHHKSKKIKKKSKSEKKREKKSKKKSKKYESESDSVDSGSDGDDGSSDRHHKKKHKKSKSKRKHSQKRKGEDDSDDSESRDGKRRKKHKKSSSRKDSKRSRRSKHAYSSDEDSYSSDDGSRSNRTSKKSKKRKRESKSKSKKSATDATKEQNTFGKYGIIKESDLRTSSKVQRNFEIWLEEVKGVPQGTNVPKWEMTENFKEYAEDFNTATLPHEKYYDYDKWEMEEYNRKKAESTSKKGAISDEFQFQEEKKKQAEDKRRRELDLVRMTMSKDKIEEMKRQARLKAEMVNAYRVGDEQKRKKLQKKLEPDQK